MKKVCPKCKGNGYHKIPRDDGQIWLAPFTLGISLIRDEQECKVCDGEGYIED